MKVISPFIPFILTEENISDYEFEKKFTEAEENYRLQTQELSSEEKQKWKLNNPEIFQLARIWTLYITELFFTKKTTESLKNWLNSRPDLQYNLAQAIQVSKNIKKASNIPDNDPNQEFEEKFKEAKELVASQNTNLSSGEFQEWKKNNPEVMWRARVWALYQQANTDMPLEDWINNNPEHKDNPYLKSTLALSKSQKPKYLDLPNPEPKNPSNTNIDGMNLFIPDLGGKSVSQVSSLYRKYLRQAKIYNKYVTPKSFAEWLEDYNKYQTKKSAISPVEQEYLDAYNLYIRLTTNPREKLTKEKFIEKYPEKYEKAIIQGRYNNYRENRKNSPTNPDLLSFDDWLAKFKDQQPDPNEKTPLEQEFSKNHSKYISALRKGKFTKDEFRELYPEEYEKWRVYKLYKSYIKNQRDINKRRKGPAKPLMSFDDWYQYRQEKEAKVASRSPLEQEYIDAYNIRNKTTSGKAISIEKQFKEEYPEVNIKAEIYANYMSYTQRVKPNLPIPFDEWYKDHQEKRAQKQARETNMSPLEREHIDANIRYTRIKKSEKGREEFKKSNPEDYEKVKTINNFYRTRNKDQSFDEWYKDRQEKQAQKQAREANMSPLEREHRDSYNFFSLLVKNREELSKEDFMRKYPKKYQQYSVWASYNARRNKLMSFDEWYKKYQERQAKYTPLEREYMRASNLYSSLVNSTKKLSREDFMKKYPEEFKKNRVWDFYRKRKSNFKSFEDFLKGYKPELNELNMKINKYPKSLILEGIEDIPDEEKPYYIALKKAVSLQNNNRLDKWKDENPQEFKKALLYSEYMKSNSKFKFSAYLKTRYQNKLMTKDFNLESFPRYDQPYVKAYKDFLQAKSDLELPTWRKNNPKDYDKALKMQIYLKHVKENPFEDLNFKEYMQLYGPKLPSAGTPTILPPKISKADIFKMTNPELSKNDLNLILKLASEKDYSYTDKTIPIDQSEEDIEKRLWLSSLIDKYVDVVNYSRKYNKSFPKFDEFVYKELVIRLKEQGKRIPSFKEFTDSRKKTVYNKSSSKSFPKPDNVDIDDNFNYDDSNDLERPPGLSDIDVEF